MDNNLTIFENEDFGRVRTVKVNGEFWFISKDIVTALGYKNPRKAILDHIDNDDKGVTKQNTPGGMQNISIINESGLYSLILSSKLPSAKKFKHWVTSEVLPTLRKTGEYKTNNVNEKCKISKVLEENFEIAKLYSEHLGVDKGLIYSVAVSKTEEETGKSLQIYKQFLPAYEEKELGTYSPTQLAKELNLSSPQLVNNILETLGMQIKDNKQWQPTEKGKEYCTLVPYTRQGHSGYRPLWKNSVLEVIKRG